MRAAKLATVVTAAAMLAAVVATTLAACDRERPQLLLIRGTPEATPTTARVIAPASTPSSISTPILLAEPTPPTSIPSATSTLAPAPTRTLPLVPAVSATVTNVPTATPQSGIVPPPSATATAVPTSTMAPTPRVHIVQVGETLAIIAQRYSVTITDTARLNNLANVNRIYVGQRLLIP